MLYSILDADFSSTFLSIQKLLHTTEFQEFIRDSIRFKLTMLSHECEYIEITKEQYDLLNEAVKEMSAPYYTTEDFVNT